jgi:hypothetical protein
MACAPFGLVLLWNQPLNRGRLSRALGQLHAAAMDDLRLCRHQRRQSERSVSNGAHRVLWGATFLLALLEEGARNPSLEERAIQLATIREELDSYTVELMLRTAVSVILGRPA